jgi:hypothetical protein
LCQICLELDHPVLISLDFATVFLIVFTEQGRHPFVQPSTWRNRALIHKFHLRKIRRKEESRESFGDIIEKDEVLRGGQKKASA